MGAVTGYSKLLAHLPVFAGLSNVEAGDLAQFMHLEQKQPGADLCKEGEPGDAMFVLEKGTVVALKRTDQGDDQVLATIVGPSVVGELALIDGAPRSATVRAKTVITVYRIAVKDFDRLREKHHTGAHKVLKNLALMLCERLRDTNDRISEFFSDPQKSLAAIQRRQKELWQKRQQGAAE